MVSTAAVALLAGAATAPATAASIAQATDAPTPSSSGGGASVRVIAADDTDVAAEASAAVAAMSTREKAASIVMGHVPTTDAAALRAYMTDNSLGGFILMGANIPAAEPDLRALTAALTVDPARPPLIAVDQEGDDVSRLSWDDFASSVTLKNADPADTTAAFAARAALVQRAGIGVNFGIVADVTTDPSMFIYRRALGTTPDASSARVSAAVDGEADETLSTLKHFPGHGAAPGDSHSSIPSTTMSKADWEASDALPFQAGVKQGAPLLMFGHLAYTAVDAAPASMSAEWHRIAREELGFSGVAITDDMGMLQAAGVPEYRDPVANAVTAIAVGNDMVLAVLSTTPQSAARTVDGIAAAVDAGTLPQSRLDEAAARVMALRLHVAAQGRGLVPYADCSPAG